MKRWKIERAGEILQGVRATCEPYEAILEAPARNAFIMIDPPYEIAGSGPLYQHNFTPEQHVELHKRLLALDPTTHKFLLTIGNTELTRDLYCDEPQLRVLPRTYPSGISFNRRSGKQRLARELMVMNY